ncbi:hypothetical protein GQ53DRAFT_809651 [Thozetella sp. PMI_491]|nr:hypothetical protein GQ53DRAFT_809651 [Thozetella sp. PMI_491]
MRVIFQGLFLSTAAWALPQSDGGMTETISIGDLSVRIPYGSDTIESVYFRLNGTDATNLDCLATSPGLKWTVFTCGDSKYRFGLGPGTNVTYALRIYHELGIAFGRTGVGDVFTYCHAGGGNVETCNQLYPVTIEIYSA